MKTCLALAALMLVLPGMAGIERADSFMFTYEHEAYEVRGSSRSHDENSISIALTPILCRR